MSTTASSVLNETQITITIAPELGDANRPLKSLADMIKEKQEKSNQIVASATEKKKLKDIDMAALRKVFGNHVQRLSDVFPVPQDIDLNTDIDAVIIYYGLSIVASDTLLVFSCRQGYADAVRILLESGAHPMVPTAASATKGGLFDGANGMGSRGRAQYYPLELGDASCVKHLLNHPKCDLAASIQDIPNWTLFEEILTDCGNSFRGNRTSGAVFNAIDFWKEQGLHRIPHVKTLRVLLSYVYENMHSFEQEILNLLKNLVPANRADIILEYGFFKIEFFREISPRIQELAPCMKTQFIQYAKEAYENRKHKEEVRNLRAEVTHLRELLAQNTVASEAGSTKPQTTAEPLLQLYTAASTVVTSTSLEPVQPPPGKYGRRSPQWGTTRRLGNDSNGSTNS